MPDRPLPRPRAEMARLEPYRTQQQEADVRVQSNEWPEPNLAGHWISHGELDRLALNRYPGTGDELRRILAERWGVRPEQLILGNGSNEVLLLLFLVFGGHGRTTLLFQPTYSMHSRLATIAGGRVVDELIGLPYDLGRDRALGAVARVRPEIVVFTSPNNPTGNTVDHDVIRDVAERFPETVVLVDEAYADFAGATLARDVDHYPNLAVSRTFSKARAAAGLRVGVLIAHPELVGYLAAAQLPYNMNALTLAVATRIARDDAAVERRLRLASTERVRLDRALRRVGAIDVFPSVANFILIRLRENDPADVHARFLAHSVLVRDVSGWPGCAGCLRISVGTHHENDRVINALDEVFAAPGPAVASPRGSRVPRRVSARGASRGRASRRGGRSAR
jgi:histidinol-phosphate aminotransferase